MARRQHCIEQHFQPARVFLAADGAGADEIDILNQYLTIARALQLGGQWRKATPAFNRELCEKFRIQTLEFDGTDDSIYHPFDLDGRQHMEYLAYRGEYADVPLAQMRADFAKYYPSMDENLKGQDFDREVDQEIAAGSN